MTIGDRFYFSNKLISRGIYLGRFKLVIHCKVSFLRRQDVLETCFCGYGHCILNLSIAALVICHIWTVSRLKHCSWLSSFPLIELYLIKDIWHRKRGTHFSSFNRLKFFFVICKFFFNFDRRLNSAWSVY